MSLCAISASAESWIDFSYPASEFYNAIPTSIGKYPNSISRDDANLYFYGTPNGAVPPASGSGKIPLNDIKGVIVLKDNSSPYRPLVTWIYCTNLLPGQNMQLSRVQDGALFIRTSSTVYGWYSVSYHSSTKIMTGFDSYGNYPDINGVGLSYTEILYSDYNLVYNNNIFFKSTTSGTYFDTLETNLNVNSSGITGQIRRNSSHDFDSTKIYYRTVVVDSAYDPPIIGYTIGKSLAQQNITPINLYEPNYNSLYPNHIDEFSHKYPILSNEFSGLYNISPVNLPVLNAYMQGSLQYDKSYTCIVLVNSQWTPDFKNWIVIGAQKFNFSQGTIIDLGVPTSPDNDTPGGVDLGATPPEHNWTVNGSDVVVPEIDFTSPEYKNPFDVSFLFFYPENGENKPTFYLQYCLIAIAICAIAYLLFGKS